MTEVGQNCTVDSRISLGKRLLTVTTMLKEISESRRNPEIPTFVYSFVVPCAICVEGCLDMLCFVRRVVALCGACYSMLFLVLAVMVMNQLTKETEFLISLKENNKIYRLVIT